MKPAEARRRLAAAVVSGLVLLGCSDGGSSGGVDAHRTPAPAASTGPVGSPTPTPNATPKLGPALEHMLTVIHAQGYQTFAHELRQAGDFYPGLRPVLVAKPRYLGNGFRCANVLFFSHGHYVGRDSASCHLYPEIDWAGSREVSIVYPRYAKQDALCCPTPDPKRVIFRLRDGHMELVTGPPPNMPS